MIQSRRVLRTVLIFVAMAVICSFTVSASPAKPVIGLVMKSLANEFFKNMEEGALKYTAQQSNFTLIPVGMNSETDIDTQISAMDNLIAKKADIIVLAPADAVALVPSVKRAIDAHIVVVNIDVNLDPDALDRAGLHNFLFVGPDNTLASQMVGDLLAAKLGPGGKVFIIEGNPGASNAAQRKQGFMNSVAKGNLKLLASMTAHWETEEANTVTTNLLTRYPDVQGIMASNDSEALGVVKALDAAGMTNKVIVVGFDNIAPAQVLIKQGKMLATIDQFGQDLAIEGIKVGLKILHGQKLSGWQKTPVRVITAADLK